MAILTVWQGPARCEIEFQPPQPLDQILNQNGYKDIKTVKDYNGINRVVCALK